MTPEGNGIQRTSRVSSRVFFWGEMKRHYPSGILRGCGLQCIGSYNVFSSLDCFFVLVRTRYIGLSLADLGEFAAVDNFHQKEPVPSTRYYILSLGRRISADTP